MYLKMFIITLDVLVRILCFHILKERSLHELRHEHVKKISDTDEKKKNPMVCTNTYNHTRSSETRPYLFAIVQTCKLYKFIISA